NFQNTGWWYDYFSGDSINVTNTAMTMNLKPGEFHIYSTVKLPTPEAGLITSVDEELTFTPAQFQLYQNYPNPFNPVTNIKFHIPKTTHVTLKVFDILGREVATLVNEVKEVGVHHSEFHIPNSALCNGVYIYKLTAGNFTAQKKMIVLK
ncbi:MAG: T9SS type A sorting domain-containing protein, partial [Bacteroidetes bacterium]|nr:T9SS type A sorting domain-containing protein [Bacteroidota bacterium]